MTARVFCSHGERERTGEREARNEWKSKNIFTPEMNKAIVFLFTLAREPREGEKERGSSIQSRVWESFPN